MSGNAIVVVTTSVVQAPTPSRLQQSGAFISQGGTSLAANTLQSIPTLAALTAILSAAKAITSMTWSGNVVTVTTTAPHGWTNGDVVPAVIAGVTPAGYNGNFNITITGASTFTYPLVSNPGSSTVQGTVILADESELLAMATTYFAGPSVVAPYVLELGEGTATEGVAELSAWIGTQSPQLIYAYLVPREWDANAAFLTFAATFTAPNKETYFYVTTTVANRASYAGLKAVIAEVEAPAIPATEFSLAAFFSNALSANPGSTTPVPPASYQPLYGVTAYPTAGNSAIFTELKAANVNWVGTGAEGGLPTTDIFFNGQMSDGNPWNFWYSVDWAQLNLDLALANEIINGSVPGLAPLYYNQQGISRLQQRGVSVLQQAITNGLAVGTVLATALPAAVFANNYASGLYVNQLVLNAEPFVVNALENPNDYPQGIYRGLSCAYTPSRGFLQILFQLQAQNFIAL